MAFLNTFIAELVKWEHTTIERASNFEFSDYTKDKDFMEKLLIEFLDHNPKIMRNSLLSSIDRYTQNDREIARNVMKKDLRFNPRKDKYYYIGKVLPNNAFSYERLSIEADLNVGEWQRFTFENFFG